jgi:hypothetical protein
MILCRRVMGKIKKKQEEQQKKVQDKLGVLQHMLEDVNLMKEHRSGEEPLIGTRREV